MHHLRQRNKKEKTMKNLSKMTKSEKFLFSGKMYLFAAVCFLLVCFLEKGASSIVQPYFSLGCACLCIGLALIKNGKNSEEKDN